MAEGRTRPSLPPEELLVSELPWIEKVVECVCRRHRCRAEEAEEFLAQVKLKLVADDYAVLRRFKGESSLKTYLTMVIQNYFRDYCDHRWGKWRPSAEAVRQGPVAVQLEKLLRDGYSFDEACEVLRTNHHVELSRAELAEMAGRLPPRQPRRFEGDESLAAMPAAEPGPEERALALERAEVRRRVAAALARALEALPPDDRVIMKLHYEEGFHWVDITRTLHLDRAGIYRHKERIEKGLRGALQQEGVRWEDVADALGLNRSSSPGRPKSAA